MTVFDDLLEAYTPMLERAVWKYGASHIREECLQEARLGLFEAYKNHRIDHEAFGGIVWASARKRIIRCVGAMAGAVRRPETEPHADGPECVAGLAYEAAEGPLPDAQLSVARATRRVQERIAELTALMPKHEAAATALLLGPVQPPRWAEAAERLGTSTEALTVARRRAERLLAKGISSELAVELIGDA